MSKRAATPVRFDAAVADRLSSFVAANPGMSLSSAANRLVDEALRVSEHPGIVFRPGPTGRRAGLAGGPDVWEAVRAIKSAPAAEPGLAEDDLLTMVGGNTGVPVRLLRIAIPYWASYPTPARPPPAVPPPAIAPPAGGLARRSTAPASSTRPATRQPSTDPAVPVRAYGRPPVPARPCLGRTGLVRQRTANG